MLPPGTPRPVPAATGQARSLVCSCSCSSLSQDKPNKWVVTRAGGEGRGGEGSPRRTARKRIKSPDHTPMSKLSLVAFPFPFPHSHPHASQRGKGSEAKAKAMAKCSHFAYAHKSIKTIWQWKKAQTFRRLLVQGMVGKGEGRRAHPSHWRPL